MSTYRKTLPAVSFTVTTRVLVLAAGLAASIVTARTLGVEGRGQYYAVVTLAGIIAQIGNLGLSSSNTYLASRDPLHAWPLVVNSLWISAGLGVLSAILVAVFGMQLSSSLNIPKPIAWSVCLLAPGILTFTLCSGILVARQRFTAMNLWTLANSILVLAGVLLCSRMHLGVTGFILVTVMAAIASAAGLTVDLGAGLERASGWAFDLSRLGAGLQFASRAYLALLSGFLIQKAGVALLTAYRTPADIGYFSIAAQIADVLAILPTSMAMVLFPILIREPKGAWASTRQAALVVLAVMVLACVGVWFFGDWAIRLVFGDRFGPAYRVLLWLMPSVLALSVTSILSQFVVSGGFPRSLVALWVAGVALCIAIGVPLVSSAAGIGAAQAQSLAAIVVCAGVVVLAFRKARAAG